MQAKFRIFLLIAVIAVGFSPYAAAEDAQASYEVVPGWPQLPEGFVCGETAAVGVDSHNHVFIFHRGKERPILCVEADTGTIVHSFGEGLFVNAHGLEIDSEDHVWVTDTLTHQVLKFTHDGDLLLTVGEKGVPGWDEGHFNQPTDVVVTSNGEFYVSDGYVNSRVAKFSASGTFLFEWGKKGTAPGEFRLPHGLARDPEGRIYVADRSNKRIQVFDAQGKFLTQWGSDQLGEVGRPWGLEVAFDEYLYVVDGGDMNSRTPDRAQILIMTLQGEVLTKWSSYGAAPGQLSWGHDIAVGKDGAVYVAEVRNNRRAQKFVKRGRN